MALTAVSRNQKNSYHDCEMGGMGHDDEADECPPLETTQTPPNPETRPTPDLHMTPGQ